MRDGGLTLLELITALAIGSILAGAAVFELRELEREWRLGGAVRQIVLDLRMARIAAIARARTHGLRFEVPAAEYVPEHQNDAGEYAASSPRRRLPPGVLVTACSARGGAIRFRPRGNAATFGTITVETGDAEHRRIVVDMAGRIRIAR